MDMGGWYIWYIFGRILFLSQLLPSHLPPLVLLACCVSCRSSNATDAGVVCDDHTECGSVPTAALVVFLCTWVVARVAAALIEKIFYVCRFFLLFLSNFSQNCSIFTPQVPWVRELHMLWQEQAWLEVLISCSQAHTEFL